MRSRTHYICRFHDQWVEQRQSIKVEKCIFKTDYSLKLLQMSKTMPRRPLEISVPCLNGLDHLCSFWLVALAKPIQTRHSASGKQYNLQSSADKVAIPNRYLHGSVSKMYHVSTPVQSSIWHRSRRSNNSKKAQRRTHACKILQVNFATHEPSALDQLWARGWLQFVWWSLPHRQCGTIPLVMLQLLSMQLTLSLCKSNVRCP